MCGLSLIPTTGSSNVAIGCLALCTNLTGSHNIAIGTFSLSQLSCSNNVIAIGQNAGTTAATPTGLACLFGSGCSNRIILGNDAHVCAQIKVAWTVVSDVRDKAIDPEGVPYGLNFVNEITPISYCFCNRETGEVTDEKKRFGFSAQNISALEVETANPVIVSTEDPDRLFLTESHLIPVLVNAIKELSAKNDALEARIAQLENG
jgi:hypothetical protein